MWCGNIYCMIVVLLYGCLTICLCLICFTWINFILWAYVFIVILCMGYSVCFYGWDFQIERSAIRRDRDGASKRWLLLFHASGCGCMLVGPRDREIEMWSWAVRSRVAIAADSHHGARPAHNAQATIKLLRTTFHCKDKNRHKSKQRHKYRQEQEQVQTKRQKHISYETMFNFTMTASCKKDFQKIKIWFPHIT